MKFHDEIAKVAYELYEKSGHIPGRDNENWCHAERIVMARHASQETTKPIKEIVKKRPVTAAKETIGISEKTGPAKKSAAAPEGAVRIKKETSKKAVAKETKKTIKKK